MTFIYLRIKKSDGNLKKKWGLINVKRSNRIAFIFKLFILYSSMYVHALLLSCVQFFAASWTITCQAPLSMGISRQEYWSELPFPSPGIFPTQGMNLMCPAPQFFTFAPPEYGQWTNTVVIASGEQERDSAMCIHVSILPQGLSRWHWIHLGNDNGKEFTCQSRRCKFDPWVRKILWRWKMITHSSILAWKFSWTRGAWWATVHGVIKSWTWLSTHTHSPPNFLLAQAAT